MTYIACIVHKTRILKLFVEAYKTIFFIHFYTFFIHFIHLELTIIKNTNKSFKKKHVTGIRIFLKKKKTKGEQSS